MRLEIGNLKLEIVTQNPRNHGFHGCHGLQTLSAKTVACLSSDTISFVFIREDS